MLRCVFMMLPGIPALDFVVTLMNKLPLSLQVSKMNVSSFVYGYWRLKTVLKVKSTPKHLQRNIN